MAQCEEQGFSGVTGAHFAEFLKKGEELGVPIHGTNGQASKAGVTITWNYDEASSTLKIACTEAPMLMPCAMINGRIQSVMTDILSKTHLA